MDNNKRLIYFEVWEIEQRDDGTPLEDRLEPHAEALNKHLRGKEAREADLEATKKSERSIQN